MSRRQVLWPQLATSSVGTWVRAANANQVFGGYQYNSSNAVGDKLVFANTRIPVDGKIIALGTKGTTRGIVDVYYNDALVTTLNFSTTGDQTNYVASSSWSGFSGGTGAVEFRLRTGFGGFNYWPFQQIEIIDLATGTQYGTSIDDLPWFGDIPPIFYSAASAAPSLAQDAVYHWGSHLFPDASVGGWIEYQAWLPQGSVTLTITAWTFTSTDSACAVTLNGVSQGTINLNSGGGALANQQRSLSISVPYTGVHTIRLTRGTGGSYINWISWRKTAETGAIAPTGTTYGVGSRELWPWFAENSDWNVFQLASNRLHFATMYNSSTTINDSQEWTHSLLPGTYGLVTVGRGSTDYGNAHWSENGGPDLDVIDHSVTTATAHRFTGSLALLGGTIKRSVDSSNGTPANYYLNDTMIRLVRTGD